MAIDLALGTTTLNPSSGTPLRPSSSERLGFVVEGESRPSVVPESSRPVRPADESAERRAFDARDAQRGERDASAAPTRGSADSSRGQPTGDVDAQTLAARLRIDTARVASLVAPSTSGETDSAPVASFGSSFNDGVGDGLNARRDSARAAVVIDGPSDRESDGQVARLADGEVESAVESPSPQQGPSASIAGSRLDEPPTTTAQSPVAARDSAVARDSTAADELRENQARVDAAREERARQVEDQAFRSAGVEALQRRIDFAVQLANPFEPARRELNVFV
ncbi:MAG: hypothetical protein ACK4IT_05205 [Thioalkalivibrionaceae bacterium]